MGKLRDRWQFDFDGMDRWERFDEIDVGLIDGIKFHAIWDDGGDHKSIQHDSIESELIHPEVKSLTSKMAMRTLECCQGLIQFMSDTYQDYLPSFGSETTTWDFVCLCIEKVLTSEFAETKLLVNGGLDLAHTNFGSKMIWCSLRMVCVQEKFLEVGISNHPILSSTCSRYLIKSSSAFPRSYRHGQRSPSRRRPVR